jgi:hypothetical protein
MTSFIGSTKTVSVPNDLDAISLDEKQNRKSTACGQVKILNRFFFVGRALAE